MFLLYSLINWLSERLLTQNISYINIKLLWSWNVLNSFIYLCLTSMSLSKYPKYFHYEKNFWIDNIASNVCSHSLNCWRFSVSRGCHILGRCWSGTGYLPVLCLQSFQNTQTGNSLLHAKKRTVCLWEQWEYMKNALLYPWKE